MLDTPCSSLNMKPLVKYNLNKFRTWKMLILFNINIWEPYAVGYVPPLFILCKN